jgi:cell division protein FtsZ
VDTVIIAVGCAGGRMVNRIIEQGRVAADYLAIDTDQRVLDSCLAGTTLLIGETRFRGRGGASPHAALNESAAAVGAIRRACRGVVIVVAGLGKGTGTGVAPLVAGIARRQGCRTAAVVTLPLPWEGREAFVYARMALKTLGFVDRLVTVPLAELLREGTTEAEEAEVLHAGDAMVAASVERLMTPEGWNVSGVGTPRRATGLVVPGE